MLEPVPTGGRLHLPLYSLAGAPLAAPADAAVLALTLARGLARVLDGPAAGPT